MESKNLLTLAITLTVGIILAGSLLMPVISDATTTHKTFSNAEGGYFTMALDSEDSEDYTLSWAHATGGVLTINGEDFDAHATYGQATISIVMGEDWIIRYNSANDNFAYCQYFNGSTRIGAYDTTASFEMTASGGTASMTFTFNDSTTQSVTESYDKLYVINPDSEYLMKKPTTKAYVLGSTEIFAEGMTQGSGIGTQLIKIEGSINDGFTVTAQDSAVTISDITSTQTQVQGYVGLYQIEKIEFNITKNDSTVAATYNFFVVPTETSAELSNHMTSGEIAILNALPILIIVALVVMAAGALYLKRDD